MGGELGTQGRGKSTQDPADGAQIFRHGGPSDIREIGKCRKAGCFAYNFKIGKSGISGNLATWGYAP